MAKSEKGDRDCYGRGGNVQSRFPQVKAGTPQKDPKETKTQIKRPK